MAFPVSIALVGIGGWGRHILSGVLDAKPAAGVKLVAAVDPYPQSCPRLADLTTRKVPVYDTVEQLYVCHRPDLVVISSPIQMHCEQTVTALEHGSHVLCEKPLCATLEQAHEMIAARDRAQRHVAIGYQWCFATNIHQLKHDINSGLLGRPVRLSSFVGWPRDERYFTRNSWAGRQFDESGRPVFDSPVNNACAHYLQTMLHLLGGPLDRSVVPRDVSAELYRANAIENYDTAAIRCTVLDDVEISFYVTHAIAHTVGPLLNYQFEKGAISFNDVSEGIVARLKNGDVRRYGSPAVGIGKLWQTIDAIRRGEPSCCGIETAMAQTEVMWSAQQNEIVPFPPGLVRVHESEDGSPLLVVEGLQSGLLQCYRQHKLPREIGFDWAKPPVTSTVVFK